MNILMGPPEIAMIQGYLQPSHVTLEWGAGGSTVYFAKFVKEYLSVEHDRGWYEAVSRELRARRLVQVKLFHVPIRRDAATRRDIFRSYIDYPRTIQRKFDRILIDGRERVACAEIAYELLADDGILFVHDYLARPYYFGIERNWQIIDQVVHGQTLAVFRKRAKLASQRRKPAVASKLALPKVAFVSPHSIVDATSGAAISTCEMLQFLRTVGFPCEAFCASRLDAANEALMEENLANQRAKYVVRNAQVGGYRARMIFTKLGNLPVTIFNTASTRGAWVDVNEVKAFVTACDLFLAKNRPDIVVTFGGDPVAVAVQGLMMRRGIKLVFNLRNFAYHAIEPFKAAEIVVVPSEFSRQFYRKRLGLNCQVLPQIVDCKRVVATRDSKQHVTIINPQPSKGLFFFARLAEVMGSRRPDIPILVVEGRGLRNQLGRTGLDIAALPNIAYMENTPDPRTFYAASKIVLMPSLWNESFGRVAAEAMMNGIPVLASNRGALPETIGDAGFLLDIPARYTPKTRDLPTAEEVEPWVKTIIRLWDDEAEFERFSQAARARAQLWHPDRLARIYRDFFSNVAHQPGPC